MRDRESWRSVFWDDLAEDLKDRAYALEFFRFGRKLAALNEEYEPDEPDCN